jgi:hypothetical protein
MNPRLHRLALLLSILLFFHQKILSIKTFNGGFLKSFLQEDKPVVIGKWTMSPQQVPHYFECSKPFSLCMTTCVKSFPCKMIQGKNNSGKVINTWECDNGIPAIWYVNQEKAKYKTCIDECMQENKRCLIEKTLPIGEEWPLPEPEKVETKKDWKYKNLGVAGLKAYGKK